MRITKPDVSVIMVEPPFVLGHEPGGTVVEVGKERETSESG